MTGQSSDTKTPAEDQTESKLIQEGGNSTEVETSNVKTEVKEQFVSSLPKNNSISLNKTETEEEVPTSSSDSTQLSHIKNSDDDIGEKMCQEEKNSTSKINYNSASSTSQEPPQSIKLENKDESDDDEESYVYMGNLQGLRTHGIQGGSSVLVDIDDRICIEETDDNTTVIENCEELSHVLSTKASKTVFQWLEVST